MKASRCWVGLFAAMIFALGSGAAAGEPWRAVEQPELKQAFERAALLQTESLGEPSRGVVPYRDTWRAGAQPGRQDVGHASVVLQGIPRPHVALRH